MEPTSEPEATPETPPQSPEMQVTASPPAPKAATPARADLGKRFIAALIDGIGAAILSYLVGLISGILGSLLAAAYFVVRDGLEVDFMDLRSLGKRIMKLRPVRLDGKPMDLETSFKRNWMFGFGAITTILLYIPFLGWALIPVVALIALGIGIYEIYKVVTDPEGRRWGDELAGTKVIEVAE